MEGKMSQQLQILIALLCIGATFACRGGTIIQRGLTEKKKEIILDMHNKLRSDVAMGRIQGQPLGRNIMEMKWDDELASSAQRWANQCVFEHDEQQGQNLVIFSKKTRLGSDEGEFQSGIKKWFEEASHYIFGQFSRATGHYSQVIWANTNLIGCGFTYYRNATAYNKLLVCNYNPVGNIIGENPYRIGSSSCARFKMDSSRYYEGLCTDSLLQNEQDYNPDNHVYRSQFESPENTFSSIRRSDRVFQSASEFDFYNRF